MYVLNSQVDFTNVDESYKYRLLLWNRYAMTS